ncbi:MAG: ATP-binding cassette domain-containing protein, partial [Firmicutes bacterium]|nr:ATP-binding cassette domain-containing protein [Bacillota bacterium]
MSRHVKRGKDPAKRFTKGSLLKYFLRGSLHFFILSVICSMTFILAEQLIPQIIRYTVDNVLGTEQAQLPAVVLNWINGAGGTAFLRAHLWLIAILIVVIALIVAVFRYLVNVLNNKGAETLMQTMRNSLFAQIQRLPFAWHMQNQTGDIIQRCTSDADRIRVFISEQLVSVLRIVIMIGLSLYFMYSMNVKLALIATASIPAVCLYSAYFHNRIHKHFTEVDENEGILSTIAQENLTGVRVVRAFGREEFERERFEKQNDHYANLWVKLMGLMASFWSSADFICGVQRLLILVFGAVFCVRGEMSPGEFLAFISYIGWIIWPVRQLGRMISEMSKADVSIERIMFIMNSEVEKDPPGALEPDMRGDIVYDHVSFGYDEQVPVLEDVSFTIKQGTTFGILGGTGSGKSTLVLLLDKLYPLSEGSGTISIGGVNIADIRAGWLRKNIGMVLQEPFLFSRTIAENIGITQKDMPMDEIRRAAGIACVDEAITEFSKGYDTVVGERGVTLSGGQKQ